MTYRMPLKSVTIARLVLEMPPLPDRGPEFARAVFALLEKAYEQGYDDGVAISLEELSLDPDIEDVPRELVMNPQTGALE
jgi:hypothetical protein